MLLAFSSLTSLLLAWDAPPAHAQQPYPTRPITYVVPYPPGGVTDTSARVIGRMLSEALGQPLIIENRGGAGGVIATLNVTRAAPDGYTIEQVTSGIMTISPHIDRPAYDVLTALQPIAELATTYTALIASPAFPPNTLGEVIDYAKRHPGKVFFGSSGTGGISHLTGELLKEAAGIDIIHVPYRGSADALTDLIAGRIQLFFDSTPIERIRSGQAKGIAAVGRNRIKQLPDLPTIYEAGLPNFKGGDAWLGLVVPAGVRKEIVDRLESSLLKIAATPAFTEAMERFGIEVTPKGSADFARQIKDEYELYGEIIRRAHIGEVR
jgi:tripartite-type tricarboxylate transporter receptor subunit TctC